MRLIGRSHEMPHDVYHDINFSELSHGLRKRVFGVLCVSDVALKARKRRAAAFRCRCKRIKAVGPNINAQHFRSVLREHFGRLAADSGIHTGQNCNPIC